MIMYKIKENEWSTVKKMVKNLNLGNFFDDFEVRYLQIENFSEE